MNTKHSILEAGIILESESPWIAQEILQLARLHYPLHFAWDWDRDTYDSAVGYYGRGNIYINWSRTFGAASRPRWQQQLIHAKIIAHEVTHGLMGLAGGRDSRFRTILAFASMGIFGANDVEMKMEPSATSARDCAVDRARRMTDEACGLAGRSGKYPGECDRYDELLADFGSIWLISKLESLPNKARNAARKAPEKLLARVNAQPSRERDTLMLVQELAQHLLYDPTTLHLSQLECLQHMGSVMKGIGARPKQPFDPLFTESDEPHFPDPEVLVTVTESNISLIPVKIAPATKVQAEERFSL